jgi:hypothetical protein
MTDEDRLRALVAAVADGTPVDWQRAESARRATKSGLSSGSSVSSRHCPM